MSAAFLKGYNFKELESLGVKREIYAFHPPPMAWELLAEIDFETFGHALADPNSYVFVGDKSAYGLRDAPLLWQFRAICRFKKGGYVATRHDVCCFVLRDAISHKLRAILTLHVDDILATAELKVLEELRTMLALEFGELELHINEFRHFGVDIRRTTGQITMSQSEYLKDLKPMPVPTRIAKITTITPTEVTAFRALVSAVAWVGVTSPQALSSASLLQGALPLPTYDDVNKLNTNLAQLIATYKPLLYKVIPKPWRILDLGDSAFANSNKYSQNGFLLFVTNASANELCGQFAMLDFKSGKSKRVATSTMHAEALSAVSGIESATFLQTYLLEIEVPGLSSLQLLEPEKHPQLIPIVLAPDCNDLYDVLSSAAQAGISNKHLALYVAALREFRSVGRVQSFVWIDTRDMLANGLTKMLESGEVPLEDLDYFLETTVWNPKHAYQWNRMWCAA